MDTIVIVGASLAGGRAAETLRQEGFDGRIVLVGAEPERPYERPPLSKEYLWGEATADDTYLRPQEYYAEQAIELRLGTPATRLLPASRTLELADGACLTYDRLLIATGASPRRLAVPGADLTGVLTLRTLADAGKLRSRLRGGGRAVVVGAGFIGAEVAASCRRAGLEVVLLEAGAVPLERALGREAGQRYAAIHRAQGVDLRTNEQVIGFHGQGRVAQVLAASGAVFDCDFAVVGVGVIPAVDWLADSGLALDNGVLVDEFCRTNLPDIFAAGDVANWWHPDLGERLRVEHYDNAQHQGVAAARSMIGKGEAYAPVPYFWSDQYGLNLQYVGHAGGEDEVVFRGAAGDDWSAFYLRDDRLRAALAVNRPRERSAARQLIARQTPVTARQLADERTDLRALAAEPVAGGRHP